MTVRPLGFLGLGADEVELENQIELGKDTKLIEADESPISPALETVGGGQERAAARPGHGERRRGQSMAARA
jgi:hypothetical protein